MFNFSELTYDCVAITIKYTFKKLPKLFKVCTKQTNDFSVFANFALSPR